jgi:hypothetical protein
MGRADRDGQWREPGWSLPARLAGIPEDGLYFAVNVSTPEFLKAIGQR